MIYRIIYKVVALVAAHGFVDEFSDESFLDWLAILADDLELENWCSEFSFNDAFEAVVEGGSVLVNSDFRLIGDGHPFAESNKDLSLRGIEETKEDSLDDIAVVAIGEEAPEDEA